jgi:hypothetical protein
MPIKIHASRIRVFAIMMPMTAMESEFLPPESMSPLEYKGEMEISLSAVECEKWCGVWRRGRESALA